MTTDWTCPNCRKQNPDSSKTCKHCQCTSWHKAWREKDKEYSAKIKEQNKLISEQLAAKNYKEVSQLFKARRRIYKEFKSCMEEEFYSYFDTDVLKKKIEDSLTVTAARETFPNASDYWKYSEKEAKKVVYASVIAFVGILLVIGLILSSIGGGGSGSGDTSRCGVCNRTFEAGTSDARKINKTNMCERCYSNYKYASNAYNNASNYNY